MIEIIVLYFLTKNIGKTAARKGLKPLSWKIYTIIGWLFFEMIGAMVGFMLFGMHNLVSVILTGIAFAITSYYLIKAQLNKLPNKDFEDEINNFGNP